MAPPEPAGAKSMKDSISVSKEPPKEENGKNTSNGFTGSKITMRTPPQNTAKPTLSELLPRPTTTPPSMPAGELMSISDSQQSVQMRGSQNKIEEFIKDIEELRKFIQESRAKGCDDAVERADKLIKDMRDYSTAQETPRGSSPISDKKSKPKLLSRSNINSKHCRLI